MHKNSSSKQNEIIENSKYLPKMHDEMQDEIKELSQKKQKDVDNLVEAISSSGLEEFIEYIRSPWKMLWPNFIAGVARGVGALLGAALVIAIIGWILTKVVSLPLIGESLSPYVKEIQSEIDRYKESTNYKPHFVEMEKLLREIRNELKK